MSDTRTIAQQLADFATIAQVAIPEDVQADISLRVLDVVGNCMAAAASTADFEPHIAIAQVVLATGGRPEATAFGLSAGLPAPSAALVNGTLAHELDFDDTHLPSVLHPSAVIVPAALAVAEAVGASGAELVAAIAVGNEICVRVGMAAYLPELRNSVFFERGFAATAICGAVGASAAAGRLLKLDAEEMASALGVSAGFGAGLLEANRTGGNVKRIQCGWAAQAGIQAAQFAAHGITGPPTVFEGRFGFLNAFIGSSDPAPGMVEDIGKRWELLRVVYKPYPSNHFTHPVVDCALAFLAEGLDPRQIEAVEVGVSAATKRTVGEPATEKAQPRSAYHAKFSAPYVLACALLGGGGLGVYLNDFSEERFPDPARLALAQRVRVIADPVCDAEFPGALSAVVRIRTQDGSLSQHRVHSSRGGPDNPMSADDITQKFILNASQIMSEQSAKETAPRVLRLADDQQIGRLDWITPIEKS